MVCKLLPHNSLSLRIILFSPAVDDVYDSRIFFPPPEIYCVPDNAARRSSFLGVIFFSFFGARYRELFTHFFLNAPFCFER